MDRALHKLYFLRSRLDFIQIEHSNFPTTTTRIVIMRSALLIILVFLTFTGEDVKAQSICNSDEYVTAYKQARENEFSYLDNLSSSQLNRVHEFYSIAASSIQDQIIAEDDSESDYTPSLSNVANIATIINGNGGSDSTLGILGVFSNYVLTYENANVLNEALQEIEVLKLASAPSRAFSLSEINDQKYRKLIRDHLKSQGCSTDLTKDYSLPPHNSPQTQICKKVPSFCQ
ncbi:hypothetical protein XTPLMG728_1442 [Xanthomonas translucens pv. poae]|uniref:Uncharacterized protein n=2 Tax=Xanthomonas translucens group TaxID=3390202 RepID=A0A0K2ZUM5_9XANT|nr:hypothetical protein XTPLMG728_1442 [Xanthomonas translucens pv. poae]